MIPELGNFALCIALALALAQFVAPLVGSYRGHLTLMRLARPLAIGQFCFVAFAYLMLTLSFINNDFSVLYVAEHSNTHLPLIYRICAVWGAHEGSLLLWVFILSLWTLAVALFSKSLPRETIARVLAVLGAVSTGFLIFMIATSNPFTRIFINIPLNGADLNPVLQDPGLIGHPPMLYMGYVGFSVAYAFAITALLSGKLDAAWARWSRPWTTVAWMFLTFGIVLGSWWAYRELGWGGWWFWDPVENASFMPWLVGTALMHSLAVAEKRNTFKSWTVLLAIFTFSLSLIGTFLVRSGVLNSVHSFATDPKRGLYILIFLVIVIGASLTLYAWRVATMQAGAKFKLLSRETFLLSNNVLLVVAAATILLGTLYPLIIDALGMGKISVGPPYFNAVFGMLMLPLFVLMGVAPLTRWKITPARLLVRELWWVALVAVGLSLLLLLTLTTHTSWKIVLGLSLAFWIIFGSLKDIASKMRGRKHPWKVLTHFSRSYYAMQLAHVGLAVVIVGITLTSAYSVERDVRMQPGTVVNVAGYQFKMLGERDFKGPNYDAVGVGFDIRYGQDYVGSVEAQKRVYRASGITMTDAALNVTPLRDLYVSLGDPLQGNAWAVRLYYKPFIRWIWFGGLMMVLGGLLAVIDKRYRLSRMDKNLSVSSDISTSGGGR
tara:strand:- start:4177 stop:6165 length:1989 start_codon:yes stop_codon:yes gene_type:complete